MNPLVFAALLAASAPVAGTLPLPLLPLPPLVPDDGLRRWRSGGHQATVRQTRARDKRRRRQRERRRIALGGLPMWLVGTPGEEDWLMVAARTWQQARQVYADTAGVSIHWDCYDLDVRRAEWRLAVELEPVVTTPGVWWGNGRDASETLPNGEPVWRGYGVHYDDDSQCEECNEYVSAVVEHQTDTYAMLVCRECLAEIGGGAR